MFEARSPPGQAVQNGGGGETIAVRSHVIGAERVDRNQKEVGMGRRERPQKPSPGGGR